MKTKLLIIILLLGVVVLGDTSVKLPRPCLVEVALLPETECYGPSMKTLTCTPLSMKIRKDCEMLVVTPENKYGSTK